MLSEPIMTWSFFVVPYFNMENSQFWSRTHNIFRYLQAHRTLPWVSKIHLVILIVNLYFSGKKRRCGPLDTVVSLLGQPKGKNIYAFMHLCKLPFGPLLPSLCLSIVVTKCKGKASLVVPNYIWVLSQVSVDVEVIFCDLEAAYFFAECGSTNGLELAVTHPFEKHCF